MRESGHARLGGEQRGPGGAPVSPMERRERGTPALCRTPRTPRACWRPARSRARSWRARRAWSRPRRRAWSRRPATPSCASAPGAPRPAAPALRLSGMARCPAPARLYYGLHVADCGAGRGAQGLGHAGGRPAGGHGQPAAAGQLAAAPAAGDGGGGHAALGGRGAARAALHAPRMTCVCACMRRTRSLLGRGRRGAPTGSNHACRAGRGVRRDTGSGMLA